MIFQCTVSFYSLKVFGENIDLFQFDHPSRGPYIASCTQHPQRPNVICHQECSAQPVICCPLKSGLHQDRTWISNNPTGKSHIRVWRVLCTRYNEYSTRRVVTLKEVYALAEEVLLLNKVLWCTEISSL
ncbi:hypothetical protein AVEN_171732-1 [Araneus ventricosus]|uniref:Uncharacterized protein n=1 Tax=Araneus ventricosus TaxID=182803 RepID=A0A4Y2WGX4_ARAVE|nr:hypothetical protein AVEN_171732-1 [Araneus ventricosus]